MPLGEPGGGSTRADTAAQRPMPVRDDLDVPVIMSRPRPTCSALLRLPARPAAGLGVRPALGGRRHRARRPFQIGEFEELLGCPRPVNRGQQAYVVRAALRWLDGVGAGRRPGPTAARLEVRRRRSCATTPATPGRGPYAGVDAPVEVLRGDTEPDASYLCQLFGSTLPMDAELIRDAVRRPRGLPGGVRRRDGRGDRGRVRAGGGPRRGAGRGAAGPGARLT